MQDKYINILCIVINIRSVKKHSMYLRVAFDSFAVRFTFVFSEGLFACLMFLHFKSIFENIYF